MAAKKKQSMAKQQSQAMDDQALYKVLQHLAEIDTRFLHEVLADVPSALKLYGFQPTKEQLAAIESYREGILNKTDDQILVQLRSDIQRYRP